MKTTEKIKNIYLLDKKAIPFFGKKSLGVLTRKILLKASKKRPIHNSDNT